MNWQELRLSIPLEAKPSVSQMGVGIHGHQLVERYYLKGLWCIHVYRYDAELQLDQVVFPIRPGYASLIPPDVQQEYRYLGRSVHVYAHFRLPSAQQPTVPIPIMQDLGDKFGAFNDQMEQAISLFPAQPTRAEVQLWDILWHLTDGAASVTAESLPVHPAVQQVLNLIELRLGEKIRVEDLARDVGVSHNHLTRLFHQTRGMTISHYIQSRRVERAKHLLLYSTLPIKTIAAEVGIPDLHFFNKTVHRLMGESPRKVREHSR